MAKTNESSDLKTVRRGNRYRCHLVTLGVMGAFLLDVDCGYAQSATSTFAAFSARAGELREPYRQGAGLGAGMNIEVGLRRSAFSISMNAARVFATHGSTPGPTFYEDGLHQTTRFRGTSHEGTTEIELSAGAHLGAVYPVGARILGGWEFKTGAPYLGVAAGVVTGESVRVRVEFMLQELAAPYDRFIETWTSGRPVSTQPNGRGREWVVHKGVAVTLELPL